MMTRKRDDSRGFYILSSLSLLRSLIIVITVERKRRKYICVCVGIEQLEIVVLFVRWEFLLKIVFFIKYIEEKEETASNN